MIYLTMVTALSRYSLWRDHSAELTFRDNVVVKV